MLYTLTTTLLKFGIHSIHGTEPISDPCNTTYMFIVAQQFVVPTSENALILLHQIKCSQRNAQ